MAEAEQRVSISVPGLDDILGGGLLPHRLYLIEGEPGSGKSTLALQFLLEGIRRGERGLYITLSETTEELNSVAQSHGWSLDGMSVFELASAEEILGAEQDMTLLHPWEIELGETLKLITAEIERVDPVRVVFDSLSEMRLLAGEALRYRRQILSLKQFLAKRQATVLLLDDLTGSENGRDLQLHSMCHGVITLERQTLSFGTMRRRLLVQKMRAMRFRAGFHDYEIRRGGLEVFPRLVASEHHTDFVGEPVASGLAGLDALLGGGPLRGTSTLITGPAGCGKTTLAIQYLTAACARGERCAMYQFDERRGTLLTRCAKIGLDLAPHIQAGTLSVVQVDPAEMSPGEFIAQVRDDVQHKGSRMVVVDSLAGYLAAMSQDRELVLQLHELLSYLNQSGVATFLIHPMTGLVGAMQSNLNVSYIADAVLMTRFFEAQGRVRKAISALKNRGGPHENTIREFSIGPGGVGNGGVITGGIRIGEPLSQFQGVFTGTPTYTGADIALIGAGGAENRDSGA